MALRLAAVPIGFGLLVSSASAADEKPPAPKVAAPRASKNPSPAASNPPRPQGQAPQPDRHPGEQQADRLLRMNPAEREKVLSKYPPAQRQKIEKQLNDIKAWPTADQQRARARLERLNSLPVVRQNQVKRSANQFKLLPEERKVQITQEIHRMSTMPDDDRRAYMNTEEFRNRYSANEQQIMSNLSLIEPD